MKIQELLEKFKDAPADSILERNVELDVRVVFVPSDPLIKYTILEDETSKLDAVPSTKKIFKLLQSVNKNMKLKIRGRLDKTGFGNIAFEIEEIIK